jgi:hypothetical protein
MMALLSCASERLTDCVALQGFVGGGHRDDFLLFWFLLYFFACALGFVVVETGLENGVGAHVVVAVLF